MTFPCLRRKLGETHEESGSLLSSRTDRKLNQLSFVRWEQLYFKGGSSSLNCDLPEPPTSLSRSWSQNQIQQCQAVSKHTLSVISNKDIHEVCLSTSPADVQAARDFLDCHYISDQLDCPTGVISFDIEGIHISPLAYDDMFHFYQDDRRDVIKTEWLPFHSKKKKMIPVRILICGLDWILNIRTDVTMDITGKSGLTRFIARLFFPKCSTFLPIFPLVSAVACVPTTKTWRHT